MLTQHQTLLVLQGWAVQMHTCCAMGLRPLMWTLISGKAMGKTSCQVSRHRALRGLLKHLVHAAMLGISMSGAYSPAGCMKKVLQRCTPS